MSGVVMIVIVHAILLGVPSVPSAALDSAASSLPTACAQNSIKRSTDPLRTYLALAAADGGAQQAMSCLLQLLRKYGNHAPAWALAGAALPKHAAIMEHAAALLRGRPASRSPASC